MSREGFAIGPHPVGEGHPPYVIAEAGVHHNNSLALAKEYVTAAAVAGAHAIKFQTYKADRLAARWAPTYWDEERTQYEVFAERSLLAREDYRELARHAADVGVTFLSTPFDPDSARMLDGLGVPAFKLASADVTNHPLLEVVAGFGKPVLLSTGASTFDEARAALELLRGFDVPVALLHCNLAYPTPLAEANLRRVRALRDAFPDVVVGYSDHTQPQDSPLACPLAVALGARVIEKHFTLNKALEGDDHYHAVDAAGLARLVKDCRDAHRMTPPAAEVTESERAARENARRSVVAARAIRKGEALTMDCVDFKRPGTGLSPARVGEVLGRRAARALEADDLITPEDVE